MLTLTPEQEAYLVEYAKTHGRLWKVAISHAWASGEDENDYILRQLRNNFGHTWLANYQLPKQEEQHAKNTSSTSRVCETEDQ